MKYVALLWIISFTIIPLSYAKDIYIPVTIQSAGFQWELK